MKVVVAIDSLKGSLTSLQAGEAIKEGIIKANPCSEVFVRPLADGGEGTVEALTLGLGGTLEKIKVTGPSGRVVAAEYGIIKETKTAIIEMSAAAGITQVSGNEKNPLFTTTFGVGEIICDAMEKGCRNFIIGIGGSATNDGGLGMLTALGFEFFDKDGKMIGIYGKDLEKISIISKDNMNPLLRECKFSIACDVKNPLCGEMGCSSVYGPQKGATPEIVEKMDKWLSIYACVAAKAFLDCDPDFPGSGAAGGLGFAFRTFLSGELLGGVELVLSKTDLENYIKDADIVVTGEGRLDFQTAMGKAPIGVAKLAKKYNKPVVAFAGCVTKEAVECNKAGIDAFFPILREVVDLDTAMDSKNAAENMAATAEQVFRAININL
ncbi:MAG: glycerate kinase [Clostridia bacterium]|nr:glycerate kinase [Clostridia bacterium]